MRVEHENDTSSDHRASNKPKGCGLNCQPAYVVGADAYRNYGDVGQFFGGANER